MSLSEHDIRRIVVDEIARRFGADRQPDIKYVSTREIARILGYQNTKPIYTLINSGVLRVGEEVQDRRPAGSLKADYYFNVLAVQKRLNTPPEKRA